MRIAIAADERVGIAPLLAGALERRGHEVALHGALRPPCDRDPAGAGGEAAETGATAEWARPSAAVAREVVEGHADQGVVCCWTGTGAAIAANKVPGARAALCPDAPTAAGARRWNDANVLALSLRTTSEAELEEILDAWFAGEPSEEPQDRANVAHLAEIEGR